MSERSFITSLSCKVGIRNRHIRCLLAEMLGTFMVVLVINATIAQKVLTETTRTIKIVRQVNNKTETFATFQRQREGLNDFLSIQLAHFLALTFGVFIAGGVSGGHVNPAVTLAMALLGRLRWGLVPVYLIGQYVGAFISAPIIYGIYYWPIVDAGEGAMGIWATRPWEESTTAMAVGSSIIATFILVMSIMAASDKKNMNVPQSMVPIVVGMGAMAPGLGFGINGFALNPARDFASRIFECFLFGSKPLRKIHQIPFFFWIPGLIPFLGAILAAIVYLLFIELHHPKEQVLSRYELKKNDSSSVSSLT